MISYPKTIMRTPWMYGSNSPFEPSANIVNSCITSYGLDPVYYYTLPDFIWYAMLKHIRVNFELTDMIMFVKRGTSGTSEGLSQCSNKYARVNKNTCSRSIEIINVPDILSYQQSVRLGNVTITIRRFSLGRWRRKF